MAHKSYKSYRSYRTYGRYQEVLPSSCQKWGAHRYDRPAVITASPPAGSPCVPSPLRSPSSQLSFQGVYAAEPCTSGLRVGQKPGAIFVHRLRQLSRTGDNRTAIYATQRTAKPSSSSRRLGDPLGKLVAGLDKAVADDKAADLRAWATFLSDDQTTLDPQITAWSKKYAVRGVPLGVFENMDGPPSYRLSRDAEGDGATVRDPQGSGANFAFREGN